jgi:hypothetical protein
MAKIITKELKAVKPHNQHREWPPAPSLVKLDKTLSGLAT